MNRIFYPTFLLFCLAMALMAGCSPDNKMRQNHKQTLARWEDQRLAPQDSLTAMLRHNDAHVRLAAARSAGLIGRTDITPVLLELAEDSSVTVRAQAIFSLGFLDDARGLPVVSSALQSLHPSVRLAAAHALAHLENDGKDLMVMAVSGSQEEAIAAWDALRNMVKNTDQATLISSIKSGLLRPETAVQWHVLRCSELLPDPSLLPVIIPFAHATNAAVRVHAYRALQKYENPDAVLAVMESWQKHESFRGQKLFRVQIAGLRALGTNGNLVFSADPTDKTLQDSLASLLINSTGSTSPHVTEVALEAMGHAVDEMPLPPSAAQRESLLPVWRIRLARAAYAQIDNSHVGVRAAAMKAWALLRGAGSAGELTQRLRKEESAHVLAAGLEAIGQIHPDPVLILRQYAAGEFRTTLGQPLSPARRSAVVRTAALESLAKVQTERPEVLLAGIPRGFIPSIIGEAAKDSDFVIAATASGLLGEFPSPESLAALVTAYESSSGEGATEIQKTALSSLTTILATIPANDAVLAVVSSALDSPDVRVRLAGRETAMVTGHFEGDSLPSEESLKATIPATIHHRAQPAVTLTIPSTKIKCTTNRGVFIIALDAEIAPNTCATFLDLIEKGFYDDLTFHRVVPDFVVQGGCPRGDGWGGPGYLIRSEWSDHTYARGVVGIAHDGKDTGGSQFFVTLSAQPHLDGRYTIFGKVISGMEIVDQLEKEDQFGFEAMP
jgi:peptidyl-prolyl cis-trans isomerase B (cyclophilin B)